MLVSQALAEAQDPDFQDALMYALCDSLALTSDLFPGPFEFTGSGDMTCPDFQALVLSLARNASGESFN